LIVRQNCPFLFIGLCIFASCSSVHVSDAYLSDSDKEAIRKGMEIRYYHEGDAEAFAKRYGTDAVPFLIEMLRAKYFIS